MGAGPAGEFEEQRARLFCGLLAPGHASGQVTFEDFLAEGQR